MKKIRLIGVSVMFLVLLTPQAYASTISPFGIFDAFKSGADKERVIVQRHGPKKPPPTAE